MPHRSMALLSAALLGLAAAGQVRAADGRASAANDTGASAAPHTTRVLFVGNSHTATHRLPEVVAALAQRQGVALEVGMLAEPGHSLGDHLAGGHLQAALKRADWDWVVLQQGPSSRPESRVDLRRSVMADLEARQTLLLVDGEPKSLRVLEVSLKKAGYEVVTATHGAEALQQMVRRAPDLVISDTNLAEVDGFELCRRIKDRAGWASIPFIFVSSRTAIDKYAGGLKDYRASEGKEVVVPYKGPVKETIQEITGGLRSACAYVGATRLKDLSKCTTFVLCHRTHSTMYE